MSGDWDDLDEVLRRARKDLDLVEAERRSRDRLIGAVAFAVGGVVAAIIGFCWLLTR
jgi:hypothetical protein